MTAFRVARTVKNLLAMQETQVQSQGWADFLEKGMTTHSGILAWRSPWIEEPGRLRSMGFQRVRHDWVTNTLQRILWSGPRNWPFSRPQATFSTICDGVESCFLQGTPQHPAPGDWQKMSLNITGSEWSNKASEFGREIPRLSPK